MTSVFSWQNSVSIQYHSNPSHDPTSNAEEAEWFYEDL